LDSFEKGKKYFLSAGRMPAKIFISNPHSLNALALSLVKGFQTVNIQFFQYQSSLSIGVAWQQELQKELRDCNIFVALINDDYHKSEWCKYELKTAFDRWKAKDKDIEILPYIVEKTYLPELIKDDIQCAFVNNLPTAELVDQIVNTIDSYLVNIEQKPKENDFESEELQKVIYGKGRQWALLAGVNHYEDVANFLPLQVCAKDATDLGELIVKNGYEKSRVKTITDQGTEIPTRDNILVTLKSMATATEPDDLLLFYYSGHGTEKDGESYLVTRSGHQVLIEETSISISTIKEIMNSAQARAKVIIIDACHSGVNFGKGGEKMTESFIQRVFDDAKGFAILASCEQGQRSYEWLQNSRSVFTHYLLEALQGKADYENKGFVTIQDANRYVTDQVKLWSVENGLSQTPTLHCEISGDIILVHKIRK